MNDPIGSNDPLGPVYQQDPGSTRPVKGVGRLGSKTNLALLVVIAAVVLVILALIGGEKETEVPSQPAATEVQ
ncbi:MAG: hypothetical protein KDC00_08290 [Flavobacteriales bacterium]|nr:hypothetical protein [Flavobacteriales bacterium]